MWGVTAGSFDGLLDDMRGDLSKAYWVLAGLDYRLDLHRRTCGDVMSDEDRMRFERFSSSIVEALTVVGATRGYYS